MTISGTHLGAGSSATIGGASCTNPAINQAATALTCNAPPGTSGNQAVVVTTAGGSVSVPGGYTYTSTEPVQQVPLRDCVTPPKAIPLRGERVLLKRHCTTSAGQPVRVRVNGHLRPRGDVRLYRVIHKRNGEVRLRTYGHHLRLKITWWAPATTTYSAYELIRTYRN